jgi:hypothetical protein
MSELTTPVGVAFDLQRTTIERTHEAAKRSIEAQQAFGEALVDFAPAKRANERSYEAVHTVVDAYFSAVESAVPGQEELFGDVRAVVDEQLDTLEAAQVEALEAFEANVDDESTDELVEEFVAAIDDGVEAALETHEEVEARTVEAFDGFADSLEEVEEQLVELDA